LELLGLLPATLVRAIRALGLASLGIFLTCIDSRADGVASMHHDFNGNYDLFSYPAKPSAELGQFEALAKRQYGSLLSDVKSPATVFMCTWRNPRLGKREEDRPLEIFLSCNFGPTNIAMPKSMIELSEVFGATDRGLLTVGWELENGNYRLSRFEVEIQANRKSFRSQNLLVDMPQIQVTEDEMNFPQRSGDPLRFTLRAQLPFRRNSGDAQSEPIVSLSFSGVAEPTPKWLNY
jgi:hypothetical protein